MNNFYEQLQSRWQQGKYVCVGLDIDIEKLPSMLAPEAREAERIQQFLLAIITATHEYAVAYKFNSAHYERFGAEGVELLGVMIAYIHQEFPGLPVILDAKRGDIGDTNKFYAQAVFDELGADAVTVHPYMGYRSLEPFLSRKNKGVIVMGANSAEGAEELQDLTVGESQEPLYRYICKRVAEVWNQNGNCAVTASAIDPEKLGNIRSVIGEIPILLLGIGAQDGNLSECLKRGTAKQSFGLIINSSRAILYASSDGDFAVAAEESASSLNQTIAKLFD